MATVEEKVRSSEEPFSIPGTPLDSWENNLPDAFAPLIRNAWYAVAERRDVGREFRSIVALGEPLVMYRTEAGEAIVLDDRCAHRRFKLSKGKLIGDTVQCGYHGYTYDKSGACVWAPMLKSKPHFGVRRYPAAEVGPWVWVWMGDPKKADVANVPYPKLDPNVDFRRVEGYKLNPGNYMLVIENLIDLTHLHFLHGVSTLEQADNPPKSIDVGPNAVSRSTETETAGVFFTALAGDDPKRVVRIHSTDSQFGPSLNYGVDVCFARPGEESPLYPLQFHIMHALTPEDLSHTHQFFQIAFSADMPSGLEKFRDVARDVVFEQDVGVIASMQETIASDHRRGTVEFGTPGDRFGVKMRQILRRMKRDEA